MDCHGNLSWTRGLTGPHPDPLLKVIAHEKTAIKLCGEIAPFTVDSPGLRFAGPPPLRLRRKEGKGKNVEIPSLRGA